MAFGINPMTMGSINSGGGSQQMQMMQLMQMIQMMQSMMGQRGGAQGGGGCRCCHQGMGQTMRMPGNAQGGSPVMPYPMQNMGGYPSFSSGQNAPGISNSALQNATPTGRALADSIMRTPNPPNTRPGYCYRGVKHHLRQVGVNLRGGSAFQAADQLAQQNGKFGEVRVSRNQLKKLPPGAVVVWDQSPGKPHGHISIATGDGREASDKIRNQMTQRNANYRVFIPK